MPYLAWSTDRYENQHAEIFTTESSDRAFEEEVMLLVWCRSEQVGRSRRNFDDANEAYHCSLQHETIALAFSITEEAIEDNLYDRLGSRYTRALARSMAHTKQVKAAAVLNNAFTGGLLLEVMELHFVQRAHPLTTVGPLQTNQRTAADLNETSLGRCFDHIAGFVDERGLKLLFAV